MGAHRFGRRLAAAFGCTLLAASGVPAEGLRDETPAAGSGAPAREPAGSPSDPGSRAGALRDDFGPAQLASGTWFVCHRDENAFSVVPVPGQGFSAAKALVRAGPGVARPGASGAHKACADERGAYRRDGAQRAELWEEDSLHQPFGTEVWYQFAMFVDPTVSPRHGHLVIGQWKQRGGNSPFVAQRFRGRSFTITIEQDNRSPGRDPRRTQCRVEVASDRADPPLLQPAAAPSAGHGEAAPVRRLGPGAPEGCATDLAVERFGPLPDPFGRWTVMRYRIRATAGSDGLLEVWADGRPIVRVTGRFGFAADRDTADQYFKFGPYRESAEGEIYAMIARFRRGPTLEDVAQD